MKGQEKYHFRMKDEGEAWKEGPIITVMDIAAERDNRKTDKKVCQVLETAENT